MTDRLRAWREWLVDRTLGLLGFLLALAAYLRYQVNEPLEEDESPPR